MLINGVSASGFFDSSEENENENKMRESSAKNIPLAFNMEKIKADLARARVQKKKDTGSREPVYDTKMVYVYKHIFSHLLIYHLDTIYNINKRSVHPLSDYISPLLRVLSLWYLSSLSYFFSFSRSVYLFSHLFFFPFPFFSLYTVAPSLFPKAPLLLQ